MAKIVIDRDDHVTSSRGYAAQCRALLATTIGKDKHSIYRSIEYQRCHQRFARVGRTIDDDQQLPVLVHPGQDLSHRSTQGTQGRGAIVTGYADRNHGTPLHTRNPATIRIPPTICRRPIRSPKKRALARITRG